MPFKHQLTPLEKKLSALASVSVLIVIILFGVDFYQKYQQQKGIDEALLLKADKENIIDYQLQSDNPANLDTNSQGIVIYRYVSSQEVPPEIYEGLQEDIDKRTDNSQVFLKSVQPIDDKTQKEEYVAKFYAAPTFQKVGDKWHYIERATTTKSAFVSQTKLTLLDQVKGFFGQRALADSTVYSGAGDGYVSKNDSDVWADTYDASVGSGFDSSSTVASVASGYNAVFINHYDIRRLFLPFDTSGIPSDAQIVSATLSVYISGVVFDMDNDGADVIYTVQTNQPDSTQLTVADYNNCGATTTPTVGDDAGYDLSSIASSTYLNIPLNSTGVSWIKRNGEASNCGTTAGYTCLGIREGHDIISLEHSGMNILPVSTSEAGISQAPYLTVSYIVATGISALKLNSGKLQLNSGYIKVNSN